MIFNIGSQGGVMKTILRTPFFLILFTLFSVSFFSSSAMGQTLPVINGSYMQQMAEVKDMQKEIDDLYRAGKQDEGEKKQMEQQIKKENAIVGEMIRLYGNNLSTELKNFALNIDASFKSYQRETELTKLLFKERKRLGEPPVGPPGVTPPGVPPVINGSYMQQMEIVEKLLEEAVEKSRSGSPREVIMQSYMESHIKKENAIVGELTRLLGDKLSADVKNFSRDVDKSLDYPQRLNAWRLALNGQKKLLGIGLGDPFPVSPPINIGGKPPIDVPPSNDPVEAAKKAKELAEQNVTTATTDLDEAKAARLAAEQKLADAKTALEKAEQALKDAIAKKDKKLQVAEKAVEDAKQRLADAKSAWITAKNELMELENKLNTVKNTYKEAEKTTRGAERALFVAENNVRKLKGQSELPVVGGSYMGQPGLPVVGGSYMGQPGLPVVGGSYQGPPQ